MLWNWLNFKSRCSRLVRFPKESGNVCNWEWDKQRCRRLVNCPMSSGSVSRSEHSYKLICSRLVNLQKQSGSHFKFEQLLNSKCFKDFRSQNSDGKVCRRNLLRISSGSSTIFSMCLSFPMELGIFNRSSVATYNSLNCIGTSDSCSHSVFNLLPFIHKTLKFFVGIPKGKEEHGQLDQWNHISSGECPARNTSSRST